MARGDQNDTERGLFGNGSLTVAARIASAFGVPALGAIVLWLGTQLWNDVRALRDDKIELARSLSGINHKLDEHSRWNAQQDSRIERLWDTIGRPPARDNSR